MSHQGPTETNKTVTDNTTAASAPKAAGQFVLDLNTLGTLRGNLRSTKATPAPVRLEATVAENTPLTTTVTVKNPNDLPKPVVKHAIIRQVTPKAPVPPVRKESLVKNPNLGRALPHAPAKKAVADVPPPVPPRDDVAPVATDVPPPVPPRDELATVNPGTTVAIPPAPPAPPAPPKLPAPAANVVVSAKPALLFSAADLAGKKLKKTVTVDKSAPLTGREVEHVAAQTVIAAKPGAVATAGQRVAPVNTGNAFNDELKARLAKRTALKVQ